jgi:PAS domain S-box-containing protein
MLGAGQFQELLDTAPDALLVTDVDGSIVYANAHAEAMFGYSVGGLAGLPIESLVPPALHGRHREHRLAYRDAPRVRAMGQGVPLTARRLDGTEFPVEIRLGPLSSSHGRLVSTIVRDASERRRFEAELIAARADAERADRAKSAFLAAASHDLRQPLQTMQLFSGVLSREVTTPDGREALAGLKAALSSVTELLNALLDISKLESGAVVPNVEDVHVRRVFERLRATFDEQARAKGLALRIEATDDVVRSDPRLLERIVQNLLVNAIRYTEHGTIELRCRHDSALAHIAVADTGVGIPAEQFDAIFDEFTRLDDTQEGLGLGLSIVRKMTALLGHTIDVSSTPGQGSCFTVHVQRAHESAAAAASPAKQVGAPASPRTVLIVDDDESILAALRLLMKSDGYRVRTANSLVAAHAALREAPAPDLVVTDHLLGKDGGTGLNVARDARATLGPAVPVIVMTGDTSGATADEVALLENASFLGKPFAPDEFLARIAEYMGRSPR